MFVDNSVYDAMLVAAAGYQNISSTLIFVARRSLISPAKKSRGNTVMCAAFPVFRNTEIFSV